MSTSDLTSALGLIAANPSRGFFAGRRDAALISKAEDALGGQLPPTYREFVQRLGAGNFGSFEVYGLIDGNFEDSTVPNGVWLTLRERRSGGISNDFIVIGSTGDGCYYCLKLRDGQDSPVLVYQPGVLINEQQGELVAENFGEFFLRHVRDQV